MFIDTNRIDNVYVHIDPVDFRKGIFGLGVYVRHHFSDQPGKQNLFVFINQSRDRLRILYWDYTGFALWQKVLEKEKFKWPKRQMSEINLSVSQLRYLLDGLDIDRERPHEILSPSVFC